MNVTLPGDLELRLEFRRLRGNLRFTQADLRAEDPLLRLLAAGWVLELWIELASIASSTGRIGYIVDEWLMAFIQERVDAVQVGAVKKGLTQHSNDGAMELPGFLRWEEGGKVWFCEVFAREHGKMLEVSNAKKGGLMRGIGYKVRAAEAEAAQHELFLDPARMRGSDNLEITPERRKQILMLIRVLDGLLGKGVRGNSEYTPGVIAAADEVWRRYSQASIERGMGWIEAQRGTGRAGLPRTTEEALQGWPGIMGKV